MRVFESGEAYRHGSQSAEGSPLTIRFSSDMCNCFSHRNRTYGDAEKLAG